MGTKTEIANNYGYIYNNYTNLFPVCDIVVEVTSDSTTPDKRLLLYKISTMDSSDFPYSYYYENLLLSNTYQPYFIDCNAKQENFPMILDYKLNEYDRNQYYVFSKIFLSPCHHIFFFSSDSGLDFNSYLIPYTLGL